MRWQASFQPFPTHDPVLCVSISNRKVYYGVVYRSLEDYACGLSVARICKTCAGTFCTKDRREARVTIPEIQSITHHAMEEDEQDDFADIYANAASTTAIQETAADEVNSHKRKHDVEDYDLDEGDNFYADKRQKTVSPTLAPSTRDISLPPELWQAISQHLTPRTLATLLRVNHMFLNCLTSEDAPNTKGCPTTSRQPMESNEVWLSSRRLYYPSLPRSSPACDERALWKLLRAENCQFCAKQATSRPDTSNPWTAGPGSDGVSIVWPFGVRSCGPCLRQRVQSVCSNIVASAHLLIPSSRTAL